ncbi:hypothetical protein C7B63_19265 [Bacillus halotolerans]|nr:hypothetical protein C7B63_19265 [Bacillus halotolerans]PRP57312.1 hypothetical protein C7B66_19280 [Bacillus halotolerans]PRP63299.1 hypothetical protein C7B72_10515 [Bacillus halotolerans]
MCEKYGLLMAIFILSLCVNSNIIVESHKIGMLIDFISFAAMVICIFVGWTMRNRKSKTD